MGKPSESSRYAVWSEKCTEDFIHAALVHVSPDPSEREELAVQ